jgi:hypothetical protein
MTPATARVATMLLAGAVALLVASGCGLLKTPPTEAQLTLERGDLVALAHGLQGLEGQLGQSAAASRAAWPYVVNGIARHSPARGRAQVEQATAAAAALKLPAVLEEAGAQALTGPSSSIAGVFRTFVGLAPRGWMLIGAAIGELSEGPRVAKSFAGETVALYIESVYDGYFSLGQIGRKLADAYRTLGGADAFPGALSPAEVDALAGVYSEATFRLQPHPGVKLGS